MSTAIPGEMTVIATAGFGGPEVLKPARAKVPLPGTGEILIKVAAAGINRPDVLQRKGGYAPPPGASDIPGLEVAGTIVAIGDGVAGWKLGDSVCALVAGGGYAEYCTAPASQALPVPRGLSQIEAAGIPETFFTVWDNVFIRGRLAAGDSFLVHGGASGVGTTAIQLARAFDAHVYATAGTPEKCMACVRLGAHRAIDYKSEDFVAVIREATSSRGVDVILDMVGGDYFARNMSILATEGRLVQIAFLKGSRVEIDLNSVMRKRLLVTGSTLRPRPIAEKSAIAAALKKKVWPLLEAGTVRPAIHVTFPLTEAAEAHRMMEADTHIGKIVLVA